MSTHPANLAVRFLLELAALFAMGRWGWDHGEGPARYLIALLVLVAAASLWGILAVPGDPSRSGKAPVPVSGIVRLEVEAVFFAFGIFAVSQSLNAALAVAMAAAVVIHYAVSYDRIAWLLRT